MKVRFALIRIVEGSIDFAVFLLLALYPPSSSFFSCFPLLSPLPLLLLLLVHKQRREPDCSVRYDLDNTCHLDDNDFFCQFKSSLVSLLWDLPFAQILLNSRFWCCARIFFSFFATEKTWKQNQTSTGSRFLSAAQYIYIYIYIYRYMYICTAYSYTAYIYIGTPVHLDSCRISRCSISTPELKSRTQHAVCMWVRTHAHTNWASYLFPRSDESLTLGTSAIRWAAENSTLALSIIIKVHTL